MADSVMTPGVVDIMDISKLKVPDLKKELKTRGLNTTGNKIDLIERLQNALKSAESTSNHESVDDLDEDLLNEEDDDVPLEETTESIISDIDTSLINDTLTQKGEKRKSDQTDSENSLTNLEKAPPAKRVFLNRNNPLITDRTSIDSKDGSEKSNGSTEDKKIIKLSTVSAKERLEMRAKKFDVSSMSNEAKKAVRAERFSSSVNSNTLKQIKVSPTADVLKKRAERFGTTVKPLTFSDSKERMEKRKARFGIVTPEDKAQQRLERFKQTVK